MTNDDYGQSQSTEYILSEPGIMRLDGKCQHEGCENQGISYDYPRLDDRTDPPIGVYCAVHAKAAGFCIGCGGFYGGIESFDFGDSPFCDDCQMDVESEIDFDDDDYDVDYY